jgi:predicted PurR-regulated permease PerM
MVDVLGSYALVLTMLMSLAIIAWFCWSIAESIIKMSQRHRKLRYKALLRENERLRRLLADAAKEHRFRKTHHTEVIRHKRNRVSRSVA